MDLHGQIMNMPFVAPSDVAWTVAELQAAKIAHRDARHAAAELAQKADAGALCSTDGSGAWVPAAQTLPAPDTDVLHAMLKVLQMIDAHYSGSLDHQPAYVKAARAVLYVCEDGGCKSS